MRINNNIPALFAYNAYSANQLNLTKNLQKLSTGLRINSAADDAAGLGISEKMRSQIGGLGQASRNAQDGISLIQTAEGALNEVHSMLQRMRELAVQAANDTLTSQDRTYIQNEIDQLKKEIDRTANTTQFNKKRLLDGSASALWSSDKLTTEAIIHKGLTSLDQFGQKINVEGNYKIEISANPGEAQIQKSNILQEKYNSYVAIQPGNYPDDMNVNGVNSTDELLSALFGDFTGIKSVTIDQNASTVQTNNYCSAATFDGMGALGLNSGVILSTGTATNLIGKNTSNSTTTNGTELDGDVDLDTITDDGIHDACKLEFDLEVEEGVFALVFEYVFASEEYPEYINGSVNDAFGFFVNGENVALTPDTNAPVSINTINHLTNSDFYIDNGENKGANITFDGYTKVLTAVVAVKPGMNHVKLAIGNGGDSILDSSVLVSMKTLSETSNEIKTKPASAKTEIKDIINNKMQYPATLEIFQGDGKSTIVTVYKNDTLHDIERKLSDAIANNFGNKSQGNRNFVTYVEGNPTKRIEIVNLENGDKGIHLYYDYPEIVSGIESVAGTFIIRSVIPGSDGELTFSGDEDLLNTLGLNTIQESHETEFVVSIYDAHSGKMIRSSQKISGNLINNAIDGVDVSFDPLAGVNATWNEVTKRYEFTRDGKYTTYLHLADNSMILQTGANEGEDFIVHIGDASSSALGLDSLLVVSLETAAQAITTLDNAIGKISTMRARLGAYQNRLEHTIANVTTAMTNLTVAESRIRDADMAKEMMSFTKLNILMQSGTAMMAQANQLPQSVLSLIQ